MAQVIVVPTDQPTIQEAVDAANENDVILVQPGTYHEAVEIKTDENQNKDGIKILAKCRCCVILDGQTDSSNLNIAFDLKGTTGVEINGFTIRNYKEDGIKISGGGFNRIIGNKIMDIIDDDDEYDADGIETRGSNGNMVWNNRVKRFEDEGIVLHEDDDIGSKSNWVIENVVSDSLDDDGLDANGNDSTDNAFIGNRSFNNDDGGIETSGENTLILNNKAFGNGDEGIDFDSDANHCIVINNELKNNANEGIAVSDHNNNFIANNEIENNDQGIGIDGDSNSIRNNEIENNTNDGIKVTGDDNLFVNNKLENNTPNVDDTGTGNVFLNNSCTPPEPPICS